MGMDAENFKRKFLSFHPKLFRIAYALVENKADAEDILQDAYFKLWNKRDELPDIENPEAFCVTLVKNLSLESPGRRYRKRIYARHRFFTGKGTGNERQGTTNPEADQPFTQKPAAGTPPQGNQRLLDG